MSIENFILIKYKKDSLDLPTPYEEAKSYLACQGYMFDLMVKQIQRFYSSATVHVLTNDELNRPGLVVHKIDFASNHCCKFFLYGLLDRPAVYLDCDILMLRPFADDELKSCHPFKVFNTSGLFRGKLLWNAGLIWIPHPDHKIVSDLQKIEAELFSDKKDMIAKKEWPYNDEYALSHYILENNLRYDKSSTVNVFRHEVNGFHNLQTVHYTGFKSKELFRAESKQLNQKIKLL